MMLFKSRYPEWDGRNPRIITLMSRGKKTVSWFSQQVTRPFKVIDVGEFHDVSWSIAIVAGLILSLNYFFKVI